MRMRRPSAKRSSPASAANDYNLIYLFKVSDFMFSASLILPGSYSFLNGFSTKMHFLTVLRDAYVQAERKPLHRGLRRQRLQIDLFK